MVFGGTGGNNRLYVQGADDTTAGAATLTIGANILVHGTQTGNISCLNAYDSIINQGTINADTANVSLLFSGAGYSTLQNSGTFEATAGAISLSNFAFNNAGNVLESGMGTFTVNSTTIKGGTLPGMTVLSTVTFDGVTLNGNVTVPSGATLNVKNGLTLANAKLILNFNNQSGPPAYVYFQGTQTLGGTGELVFGGTGGNNRLYVQGADDTTAGAATLTIGANILVHGTQTGNISCLHAYDSIINQGTINADTANVSLLFSGAGYSTLQNSGTFEATAGAISLSNFAFNNAGNVLESGMGTFTVNSTTIKGGTLPGMTVLSTVTFDGVTLNGNVTVPSGATLNVKNGLTLANAKLILNFNNQSGPPAYVYFQGTQTLGGTGELVFGGTGGNNRLYVQGADDTTAGAATLTIGANILVHGTQTGNISCLHAYDSIINQGTINADTANVSLLFSGAGYSAFINQGVIGAYNGSSLNISFAFSINGQGTINSSSTSAISFGGSVTGNSTSIGSSNLQGKTTFSGSSNSASPQLLEAMSKDLGADNSGFTKNFVFGAMVLPSSSYVKLVDQSHNSSGTGTEAVYAQTVTVPSGCTLDLNNLHFYAHGVQLSGTVVNGTITQLSNAGALEFNTPTLGYIKTSGQLDEWTVFERAGRTLSVSVNPGTTGSPAPISPQLQWANIQLLDANNNVLASAADTNSGAIVSLNGINIPADGTYKIRVNAALSHATSTGYYFINASDTTAKVFSLNLGQHSSGRISDASGVDQWNFSAMAGQQVQFSLVNSSSSAVAFQLLGPGGQILFHDLTTSSSLVNLPTSGTYTLSVYGLNGGTGAYNFVLNQTSVTALQLGTAYTGHWVGSGQAQLFTVPVGTANPLSIALSDPAAANHTEVYAKFGAPPTRETYDFAINSSGSSHSILVPLANVGTWYVLVYGESIPTSTGTFALQATSSEVVLTSSSAYSTAATVNTLFTLMGAGFNGGTRVTLLGPNGTVVATAVSTVSSPSSIIASFPAGTIPAGSYTIAVTQSSGATAQLSTPFVVAAQGQGILTTHLNVPNPVGRHAPATIYINYSNTGNAPMPAPMLILSATNPSGQKGALFTLDPMLQISGYWTSSTNPVGFSQTIQVLASGASAGYFNPVNQVKCPFIIPAGFTANGISPIRR